MDLAVVMAVYNQAETLPAAVNSILSQSFKDFEFVIVDDYSTDEAPLLLHRFAGRDERIKIIANSRHLGLTKSLNIGWRAAKTKFIARMDGDDIALPSRLKKQKDYLIRHPKIALLGTGVRLIDPAGRPLRQKLLPIDPQAIRRQILSGCPFVHPTWMLPRSILLEMEGYNEDFSFAQDYELALRIVGRYPAANLPEPLLDYRVNSPSAISLKRLKQQEALAIKARWLALTRYGYSWTESWRLVKPLLSFPVPLSIKKLVYEKIFWSGGNHRFGRLAV